MHNDGHGDLFFASQFVNGLKEDIRYTVQSQVPEDVDRAVLLAKIQQRIVDSVGVLDQQTYQGGTRGSRLCGEDRDRETEISKVCVRTRDTRFIQVRIAKVANPTSCFGIKYGALRLVLVEIGCPSRYPALLYIVQGAGS
jgi:hypothetical protein